MKNSFCKLAALALLLSTIIYQPSTVFAQGSLTPPGAPAPTMKSLAQIEPRTPIATNTTPGDASTSYVISQPGSYYLTGNIVGVSSNNAIKIVANNVTLDLGGFTIQGVSTNTTLFYNNGIIIPNAQTNITVRNGNVASWAGGIASYPSGSANLVFENLHIANCYLPPFNTSAIFTGGGSTVHNCSFEKCYTGITVNGAQTLSSSSVTGCTANDNVVGFSLYGNVVISGCTAGNNSSVGISVDGARNRIENNHVLVGTGTYGIYTAGGAYTNNIIIKNSVEQGGANNYIISGTQITGPIITTTGTITNANPWANFSF